MVQKVAVSREFEARLHHAATGKLSLSTQQKMGTFLELGKDKAAKGEGWALPFISCAQDTVGLQPPLPLRLLGYGKPLPFFIRPFEKRSYYVIPLGVRPSVCKLFRFRVTPPTVYVELS